MNKHRVPKDRIVGGRVKPDDVAFYHSPDEYRRFWDWMRGQTLDEGGVYEEDYERWLGDLAPLD